MYQTSLIISIFIDNFLCVEFSLSAECWTEEGSKIADKMINGETGEVDDECPHFQCHMDKFSPPLIHYDNVIEQENYRRW